MGWKGAVRSVQAEMRRQQREAEKRQRALVVRERELAKMEELDRARYEVELHEASIAQLISIHKDASPPINWVWIAGAPRPEKPERGSGNEERARAALNEYQPSRADRLLGRGQKKESQLQLDLEEAVVEDSQSFQQATATYLEDLEDWESSSVLAKRILEHDREAYKEAIDSLAPFGEMAELGSSAEFRIVSPTVVDATIHVHGEEVVPKRTKALLKSGRLSEKDMPKGQFYGIYQDYVCGSAIRTAREVLALLPVDTAAITAVDTLLNSASGHLEEQPILSVVIPRASIERLNLDAIDPSDAMTNFVHNMAFKKTQGFSPVVRVDPTQLNP